MPLELLELSPKCPFFKYDCDKVPFERCGVENCSLNIPLDLLYDLVGVLLGLEEHQRLLAYVLLP